MPEELGRRFREQMAAAEAGLRAIPEDAATQEVRTGGWRRKEVLGHLIDSAANNHYRFVRAALDGSYEGPAYAQDGWVELHGYRELPWQALVECWRAQNALLARVVERIPEERLRAMCRIGGGETVTLAFLIDDYLRHLHHHLAQILPAQDHRR